MKNNTSLFKIASLVAFLLLVFNASAQWQQIGTDVYGAENFGLGKSVSLSTEGNIMAVGVPNADTNGFNNGQVKVFQYDGSDWLPIGNPINGDAQNDHLGYSVAMTPNGTRIITGSPYATTPIANNAGKASIFNWDGTNWVAVGGEISGLVNSENFGWSVSISSNGNRVAVSAPLSGPAGTHLGQVRIFELNGSTWQQIGSEINGQASEDYMGYSIKLSGDGNRIVIGSHQNDAVFQDAGNVRVFEWNGANWQQMGATIDGIAANDFFGKIVDISEDGNRVVGTSVSLAGFTGEVRVYDWNGSSWNKKGESIIGE